MTPSRRGRYTARLRDLREAANLTQAEAAGEVGVSTRSYQAWEHGTVHPAARHRRKLEELFPELAAKVVTAVIALLPIL